MGQLGRGLCLLMAWSPCLSPSFARSLYYGSFNHALHRSLGNSQKILLLSILYICTICKYIKMNIQSLHQNYNCRFKSNREVEDEEELALQFIYLFYNTIRKKHGKQNIFLNVHKIQQQNLPWLASVKQTSDGKAQIDSVVLSGSVP